MVLKTSPHPRYDRRVTLANPPETSPPPKPRERRVTWSANPTTAVHDLENSPPTEAPATPDRRRSFVLPAVTPFPRGPYRREFEPIAVDTLLAGTFKDPDVKHPPKTPYRSKSIPSLIVTERHPDHVIKTLITAEAENRRRIKPIPSWARASDYRLQVEASPIKASTSYPITSISRARTSSSRSRASISQASTSRSGPSISRASTSNSRASISSRDNISITDNRRITSTAGQATSSADALDQTHDAPDLMSSGTRQKSGLTQVMGKVNLASKALQKAGSLLKRKREPPVERTHKADRFPWYGVDQAGNPIRSHIEASKARLGGLRAAKAGLTLEAYNEREAKRARTSEVDLEPAASSDHALAISSDAI